ncbi:MAG: hypothetical protein ACFB8W_21630 [Elainellaceae cyanobacterium]
MGQIFGGYFGSLAAPIQALLSSITLIGLSGFFSASLINVIEL